MCFFSKQTKTATELESRFNATFAEPDLFRSGDYNGFGFPATPVIANNSPNTIQLFRWGLVPFWAKDESVRKNTLNARIETIREKPSYRNSVKNRCLILVDGFYEWQHLDPKGKLKQKYLLTMPEQNAFALGGLWSTWKNANGEAVDTYTILTTEANDLMAQIHNTKKRMPVIVSKEIEENWLQGGDLLLGNDDLQATPI